MSPVNQELRFHPIANILPLLEGAEFRELVADIKANGLHEPIVMFDDKVLDGRNRYRACAAAGIEPTFTVYQGDDPLSYVISLNLHRRHLSESQRAMVAAKVATLRDGQRQVGKFADVPTQGESAALLKVSERTIRHAREVQERGAPELIRAVERGAVSVSAAADVVELAQDQQRELVARGEREILQAAKDIRARRSAKQREIWLARTLEMSKCNAPLPRDRRYPVILADPPWKYEAYDLESGMTRAAEVHYPTMTTDEICALAIADLATPDAALFLWATSPHLEDAFRVIDAWGFRYRTSAVWVKESPGLGYWVRNQHETLLIAARGNMRSPSEGTRPPSVITAPRREHSRKPDEGYELIERMYPEFPKIELFARQARASWHAWGNEAPVVADPWNGLDIPHSLRRDLPAKEAVA
jgi:N6-adenosine-specific RNA methylase IME4/ParB-like chromosome segregation protein Spo0J